MGLDAATPAQQLAQPAIAELEGQAVALLTAAGACELAAADTARALVWADACGRPTQGLARLPILLQRLREGGIDGTATAAATPRGEAIAEVDGRNGLGHHVGTACMQEACSRARRAGIGLALARNSNYLGATGYYAWIAAENGLLGLALSNSFPKVAGPEGREALLGTNPIGFAAPREDGRHLIVDLATAALAGSALRGMQQRGEVPPAEAMADAQASLLRPLAGGKGFGLGLLVELLAGALAGAGVGAQVRSMYGEPGQPGGNGHCMIAIDPAVVGDAEQFATALTTLLEQVGAAGDRYPGEQRMAALQRARSEGVALDPDTQTTLDTLRAQARSQRRSL